MSRIFISYRRDETAPYAGRLCDRLTQEFGKDQVFMDVDTIDLGADFLEVIKQAVSDVDVLLCVMGPEWASIADKSGRRRLDEPTDYVRSEVAIALERNIRVIPVLVKNAKMPSVNQLPPDLSALVTRNALTLSDSRFHSDTDFLVQSLRRALNEPSETREQHKPLTITTWNVQNFAKYNDTFADKLDFLIGTLQSLGSDVIALQEILDLNALEDLAAGLGFQHFAATPDARGNRVAFLTRESPVVPPQLIDQWYLPSGQEIRRFDSTGNIVDEAVLPRPALQITVANNGHEIDIINIHMKSKLLTFGGNFSTHNETLRVQTAYLALERRAGEANTLREVATGLLASGRRTVILGDFNDGPQAATTEMLYGPPGSQPRGPEDGASSAGAFQRKDSGDAQRLFNVTNLVPEEIRWSRRYQEQVELLDHILVSEGLMPRNNAGLRQVPTVSILNDDVPNLFSANPSFGGVIPDHAPVTATFV